jgi:hypothetical protein
MREILFNTPDPSGKFSRADYLSKYHIDLYNEIVNYCIEYNITDLPFKEQVYHYKHDIKENLICKNPNCNNPTHFRNSTLGYFDYCSKGCISTDPNIKQVKVNKSLATYGTNTPLQSPIVKAKGYKTNMKKYGKKIALQNPIIKQKMITNNQLKYGKDWPAQTDAFIKNRVEKFMVNVDTWHENYEKTMFELYGGTNPMLIPELKEKILKTNNEKYGCDFPLQNKELHNMGVNTRMHNLKIFKLNNISNLLDIDIDNRIYTFKCDCGCDHTFEIDYDLHKQRNYHNYKLCTVCYPTNFNNVSQPEKELLNHIREFYYTGEILENKKIIKPYELDVYIPEFKIAFEFDGLYYHSDKMLDNNYHVMKSNMCDDINIFVYHVFEDEWKYKKEIVKSNVLRLIDKSINNIEISDVTIMIIEDINIINDFIFENNICNIFFTENFICYGTYYNDELINIILFDVDNDTYELITYCEKINFNFIDGLSYLVNYLVEHNNVNTIYHTLNRVYYNYKDYILAGFGIIDQIEPDYHFVRSDKKLSKYYVNDKVDTSKLKKIYDAGSFKMIYKNKKAS